MKKTISLLLISILTGSLLFAKLPTDDERKRAFIILGGGYAFARVEGMTGEIGAELRLFGKVYARVCVDYYTCTRGKTKDSITHKEAVGINLFGIYKFKLTETIDFSFKAGGTYTLLKSDVSAFGVTYSTDEYSMGIGVGAGFEFQLNNRFYLYLDGTFKYLKSEVPFGWLKTHLGIRYRLK